jgi:hypothetical protein
MAWWVRRIATVGLALLPACATLAPPPSAIRTALSRDPVPAAPFCSGFTPHFTAGLVIAGAFLGAIAARNNFDHAGRDIGLGMVLGFALGTWLDTHPRPCREPDDTLAPSGMTQSRQLVGSRVQSTRP